MADAGRASGLRRSCLIAGILSAVLVSVGPAASTAQPAGRCEALLVPGFSPSPPPLPPSRPPQGALAPVNLPVVVHYMDSGSGHQVWKKITPQKLIEFFADGGNVNKIWQQAKVRLFLQRFEICPFSFTEFSPRDANDRVASDEIGSPVRSANGKTRFRVINQAYNATDVRALDLYVWWRIAQDGGYGDRWLPTGPRRAGAAWIDKDCAEDDHPNCDLIVAHEIGHVLGLCHACTIGTPSPNVQCVRCLPDSMKRANGTFTLANCDQAQIGKRIMRSDSLKSLLGTPHLVTNAALNQCERTTANGFAHERVGP